MIKKRELSKHERKQLEREFRRNIHQRKQNIRDTNKLKSKFPSLYILKIPFTIWDSEEEKMGNLKGEALRGVFA